jgi:2-polyprenyl-3-methyl-5-hydroxy-6-metoxy-1,4-benzoquinol methylase
LTRPSASTKTYSTRPRAEPSAIVPCALCGGSLTRPLWDCGAFSFARCVSCGLVRQNPQPLPEAVRSRYDEAYLAYEEANQEAYRDLELMALRDLDLEGAAAAAFRRAADGARPRALDVGCATGALPAALRGMGWDASGVELSEAQADYGRRRYSLDIRAGTLESAAFPDESFDLVHASHLIEHLNDPGSFLDEAARVMRHDGLLVLTTPNADGLQARLLGSAWRSAIYDHLYLFSARTLRAMLSSRGLEVSALATWGGWARGLEPAFLKRPLDRAAKRFGFGDVMAVLVRRAV